MGWQDPPSDRAVNLKWAKDRALELVDSGDTTGAFATFASDLSKFPELESSATLHRELGTIQLVSGSLSTSAEMREWIEGFN